MQSQPQPRWLIRALTLPRCMYFVLEILIACLTPRVPASQQQALLAAAHRLSQRWPYRLHVVKPNNLKAGCHLASRKFLRPVRWPSQISCIAGQLEAIHIKPELNVSTTLPCISSLTRYNGIANAVPLQSSILSSWATEVCPNDAKLC